MVATYTSRAVVGEQDPTATTEQRRKHCASDAPIFDRAILLDIQQQLQTHPSQVVLTSCTGHKTTHDLEQLFGNDQSDDNEFKLRWSIDACYRPIQDLLEDDSPGFPISLAKIGVEVQGQTTLEHIRYLFEKNTTLWQRSETRASILDHLSSIRLPRISKILCFGLGPLSMTVGDEDELAAEAAEFGRSVAEVANARQRCQTGCHTQHALIQTLRDHLRECQPDVVVKVVCQDPVYGELDEQLLSELDMPRGRDPDTFLEVDAESMVLSFYPNICVRQIVADMPRPAMMIWNTVLPTVEAELEETLQEMDKMWKKCVEAGDQWRGGKPEPKLIGGEIMGGSAWCDPSSRRVRRMTSEYDSWELPEDDNFGSNITMYVRQETKDGT